MQLVSMSRYCWHADVSPPAFLTHCENMSFSFAHDPATTAACQREGSCRQQRQHGDVASGRASHGMNVGSTSQTCRVGNAPKPPVAAWQGEGSYQRQASTSGHGFSATSGHGFRYKSSKPFNLYPARSTAAPAKKIGSRRRTSGLRPTHCAPP